MRQSKKMWGVSLIALVIGVILGAGILWLTLGAGGGSVANAPPPGQAVRKLASEKTETQNDGDFNGKSGELGLNLSSKQNAKWGDQTSQNEFSDSLGGNERHRYPQSSPVSEGCGGRRGPCSCECKASPLLGAIW